MLQDRKGIWLCRFEEEKKSHAGTIYNDVFGVTAFFDQLIARVKNVSFGRNSVGTANAIYDFMLDRIGVNDAENIEEGIDTIIHESVHALDDARNWPPGARPVFLDRVDGVGYTAAALLKRGGVHDGSLLKSIRTFESLLMDSGANATVVENGWKQCVTHLHFFAENVQIDVQYSSALPDQSRSGTTADVQAVKEDVGLSFNMTALMAAYQRRLHERAVPLTLKTTYVFSGLLNRAIPDVFLE